MENINRYWVLAWDRYYPDAGLGNVKGRFKTMEEAEAYAETITHVDYVEIEDVYYMLFDDKE